MSEAELAQEEASIKSTMNYLEQRLHVVQEERGSLAAARAEEEARASRDSFLSSSHNSTASEGYICERCNDTIAEGIPVHKTCTGKRYHLDCWARVQEQWEKDAKQACICTNCGKEWKEADGDTWKRSRIKKLWYCADCAVEKGVGGGD